MSAPCVVVVDDNPIILRMLCDLLQHEGITVHAADDAAACLRLVEKLHPRLLVLDVQLPDEDGLSVARKLKADPSTSDVIIVAVTSYAMKGDNESAIHAGCDFYVSKPIDTRTFPTMIMRYCTAAGEG